MSIPVSGLATLPIHRRGGFQVVARCVALAGLMAVELLALTNRFDAHRVAELLGLGADWALRPGLILRGLVAGAVATVAIGGRRYFAEVRRLGTPAGAPGRLAPALAIHLALLGVVLLVLGPIVLDGARPDSAVSGLGGLVLLTLSAAAWLGSWALAIFPARVWGGLARSAPDAMLGGLVVGVASSIAGPAAERLWEPLRESTFWSLRALIGVYRSDVVYDADAYVIGNSRFRVNIAPQCSGFEGMGLILAFVAAFLWWRRRELQFPRALILIPAGVAVMWLANLFRLAALIELGIRVSAAVAIGGFHSQAGWLAFNGVALGLMLLAQRSRWLMVEGTGGAEIAAGEGEPATTNPSVPYLAPLMAVVLGTMLSTAMSDGRFDYAYPLRIVLAGSAFWALRRSYRAASLEWSWVAAGAGVAVYAIWKLMEPLAPAAYSAAGPPAALTSMPAALAAAWVVARVVGSVVVVPVAEELAFRGFFIRRLIARDFETISPGRFTWLSFLVSSAVFGALHGRWLAGMLAGMLYALCLYRRGRLSDAILAHAITNGLIAADVLLAGNWNLWA